MVYIYSFLKINIAETYLFWYFKFNKTHPLLLNLESEQLPKFLLTALDVEKKNLIEQQNDRNFIPPNSYDNSIYLFIKWLYNWQLFYHFSLNNFLNFTIFWITYSLKLCEYMHSSVNHFHIKTPNDYFIKTKIIIALSHLWIYPTIK